MRYLFLLMVVLIPQVCFAEKPTRPYVEYAEAYERFQNSDDVIMVVQISATWCPPCMKMKDEIIRNSDYWDTRERVIVYVDADKDINLVNQLKVGDTLPQLMIFQKGHVRRAISGFFPFAKIRDKLREIRNK